MKLLKFSNSKNFSILFIFFTLFIKSTFATEAVDIWDIDQEMKEQEISDTIQTENINDSSQSIFQNQINKKKDPEIKEEDNLSSKNINIVGIFDPSDNDLTIDMWVNSNGTKILEIMKKINKLNLSSDSIEILNVALLTNSNFPKRNMDKEKFLKIKSDWLIKQQNPKLIKTYLNKNSNLQNSSELIKYYLDYYLSRSELSKACKIFNANNILTEDDYVSKFNIYCLVDENKKEEAQLQFDLLKETGFDDNFFEKKFNNLMGYDEIPNLDISEKNLLHFHLSHRANPDFQFVPEINTSKLIWKYLSSSNLLEGANIIDLEDKEKILTIEKAAHDKNYEEEELFAIYERFLFNINQLISVKDSYKNLSSSDSRALLYQGILLNKDPSEKIQLIKLLKESFIKDNISNAFDVKLNKFLREISPENVPSKYLSFYQFYLNEDSKKIKKIKFNNKIIHQSKLLNYFIKDINNKTIEKDLENLLKKIKKDKKYFFSTKDIILLESLKSEDVQIPKKYQNIYEVKDPNIPYDIQILINKEELGLFLLRLVEIIGEDKITDMDPETIYFMISGLNQLNIDKLRNNILLQVLPLKV